MCFCHLIGLYEVIPSPIKKAVKMKNVRTSDTSRYFSEQSKLSTNWLLIIQTKMLDK